MLAVEDDDNAQVVTATAAQYCKESGTAAAGMFKRVSHCAPSTSTQEGESRSTKAAEESPCTVPALSSCNASLLPRPPPVADQHHPYLAAGVLPFCVLGGDLLFLLGQQLRFRSRGRGSSSPEFDEALASSDVATVAANDGDAPGSDASSAKALGVETRVSPVSVPTARRPRRGPRPRLSPPVRSNLLTRGSTDSSHRFPPRPFVSETSPEGDVTRSSPPATPSGFASPRSSVDGDANGGSPGNVSANTTRPQSTRREDTVPLEATAVEEGSDTPAISAAKCDTKAEATERDSRLPFHGGELRVGDEASGSVPRRETPAPTADDASPNAAGCQLPLTAPTSSRADEQARRPALQKQQDVAREGGVVDGCCRQGVIPAGLLWSDFGGGREAGDSDAEETASREFAEESLGLFNGVRLQSDSVARSQATMASVLRDPALRGKRVFECRNGGYVMFIAEVDFVPDIMMKLARKEIVDGCGEDGGGSSKASSASASGERASCHGGFSEKTDFAWVPAASLLEAMQESRNRSTRRVVVKLGGCRYLRLFHKFVISLWRLDLAAVARAAMTPLHRLSSRGALPAPRVLLLKLGPGGGRDSAPKTKNRAEKTPATSGGKMCAIRGIDCVRPSFLSGRKRARLGIIDQAPTPAPARRFFRGGWYGGGSGAELPSESGVNAASGTTTTTGQGGILRRDTRDEPRGSGDVIYSGDDGGDDGDGGVRSRSRKSGAACRKRRRQRKEARRLRAMAAAEVTVERAEEQIKT